MKKEFQHLSLLSSSKTSLFTDSVNNIDENQVTTLNNICLVTISNKLFIPYACTSIKDVFH